MCSSIVRYVIDSLHWLCGTSLGRQNNSNCIETKKAEDVSKNCLYKMNRQIVYYFCTHRVPLLLTNESIKRQSLSENENQDHSHKQFWLLSIGPHSGITNNANSHSSTKGSKPTRKTSSKMSIAIKVVVSLVSCLINCGSIEGKYIKLRSVGFKATCKRV